MIIRMTSGKTFETVQGENLLQSLKREGVYLVASCGGKGSCGKCRVRIVEGEFDSHPGGKISRKDREKGLVLACRTIPRSDLLIEIPKESKLAVGDAIEVSKAKALPDLLRTMNGEIAPLVRYARLEITPPSLENNTGDLERLREAAAAKGLTDLKFSRDFVSSLSRLIREAGWNVNLGYSEDFTVVSIAENADSDRYGIAVDIGTTTIVLYLVRLRDGEVVDVASTYNSQIRHGDDVITRMVFAEEDKNGLQILRETVTSDLNTLLAPVIDRHRIDPASIDSAVIAGNTTMSHFFWGFDPKYIREEPYTPTVNRFPVWNGRTSKLQINSMAPVFTLPCIASYIGGDIVSGVLSCGMHRSDEIALFMDIGTNGEIVVGNREWLMTAACSAGPCFEGSGIRHGMRATEGAIESVTIDHSTRNPSIGVIGGGTPAGICGSGMIDALTEMFLSGIIDRKGKFVKERGGELIRDGSDGPEFLLYGAPGTEIVLTEVDVENIMRAKAAIYAGVSLLLREVGFSIDDIQTVYIAGGFGNYLDPEKAIIIGMLPDMPKEKFRFVGNTSVAGAYLCLLSETMRSEAAEIAAKMTNVELAVSRTFMDEYMSALFLPHTNMSLFPTVEAVMKNRQR